MSFMPNVGSRVRLVDGRVAEVSSVTPDGIGDRVMLSTGEEIAIDAWQIAEALEDEQSENDLLHDEIEALRAEVAAAHDELSRQGAPPSQASLCDRVRALVRVKQAEIDRFLVPEEEPKLPRDREGPITKFEIRTAAGVLDGYATVNFMPDGKSLREIFVRLAKPAGASEAEADYYVALSVLTDAVMMCMSKALAVGVPAAWFAKMFRWRRFEPSGPTNLMTVDDRGEPVPFRAASILDLLGFLIERYV